MNTISDRPSEVSRDRRNLAILICILAAIAFFGIWLGHEFWPGQLHSSFNPSPAWGPTSAAPPAMHPGVALGEHTFADIAQDAMPSVVNINTKSSITVPDSAFQGLPFNGFDFFFGPNQPRKFESFGTGSGIIIRSDGYILTNNHVIGKASDITVTVVPSRKFKARVIGRDSFTDLALIKVDASNLPVAKFGTTKTIRPGDFAIAIGSPLGLDHTVTMGIVSAMNRSLGELNNNVALLQTDAAINPGNSGGPLLDIHGNVIGINTAIRSGAQNIGFAIPIDVAANVARALINNGHIAHPYLGLYMQDLDAKLAKSVGLPGDATGVFIANVASDGPAEKSGLHQGDVITKIDGQSVSSAREVQTIVRKHAPGQTLHILVSRGGGLKAFAVTVGDYPVEAQQPDDSDESP